MDITNSTMRLCSIKIIEGMYHCTLSADGTVIVIDPFVNNPNEAMSPALKGSLKGFYQPVIPKLKTLVTADMMDILPSAPYSRSNSLICTKSFTENGICILGMKKIPFPSFHYTRLTNLIGQMFSVKMYKLPRFLLDLIYPVLLVIMKM